MTELHDVAVIGLGVMGSNLALNLASRGFSVLGHGRNVDKARAFAAEHPDAQLGIAEDFRALVSGLERPRRLILLVPAGAPVDAMLDQLDELLEEDDIVIDAGNSLFTDTDARHARSKGRPWHFFGMGVSGGAEGARKGPSMMPGGDSESWERLRPMLEAIAAKSAHGPCVAWCGHGSAGHFVKMVHNGIEYGDMQLIAEVVTLLRSGMGLEPETVAATFDRWNAGDLESFLIEITAEILRVKDPETSDGALLLDSVLDVAGQKGTGRWTARAALELGVAAPTISAAVDARVLSSGKDLRQQAEARFGRPAATRIEVGVDDLRDALLASKIASYTQGFALLRAGNAAYGFETEMAEVARIWTGGCIIRARLLEQVMGAFREEPELDLLALSTQVAPALAERVPAWRRVVSAASAGGHAIPGLSASLAWFETLTTANGSASLIQAQRDSFGSHGFERTDRPGVAQHAQWS